MKLTFVQNMVLIISALTASQYKTLAADTGKVVHKDKDGNELFGLSYSKGAKEGSLGKFGIVFNGEADGKLACSFMVDMSKAGDKEYVKEHFGAALVGLSAAETALGSKATEISDQIDAVFAGATAQ